MLDPSLLHAKYGRALLFAIHQQPVQGLSYLNEVNQKNPTFDGEMLCKLGQVYSVLGDKSSAYRYLREAIDHTFYRDMCMVSDPLLVSSGAKLNMPNLSSSHASATKPSVVDSSNSPLVGRIWRREFGRIRKCHTCQTGRHSPGF